MLTKIEMAIAVGLSERQLDKYLAKALSIVKLPTGQPVSLVDDNRKTRYHPEVLEEIKRGISYVRKTRYARASASRRMGARD